MKKKYFDFFIYEVGNLSTEHSLMCLTIVNLISIVHELIVRADTQDVDQHFSHCHTKTEKQYVTIWSEQ